MKPMQTLTALSVVLSVGMLSAQAQDAPQAAPMPEPKPAATQANYSQQELQAFAQAVAKVEKVAQAYQPKLASATEPEQAQKLQMEATAKMVEVVKQQGLQPEQYNEMHQQVQQDPVLLQQVQSYLK